jgi:hypothetical protein
LVMVGLLIHAMVGILGGVGRPLQNRCWGSRNRVGTRSLKMSVS